MSKMNYGPRFGSGIGGTRYSFDQRIANDMAQHPHLQKGTVKAVISTAKAWEAGEKKRREKRATRQEAQALAIEAENRALERLKVALDLLNFALDELNQAAGYGVTTPDRVSRLGLIETITKLKKAIRTGESWA